jgi:hypothetical protein
VSTSFKPLGALAGQATLAVEGAQADGVLQGEQVAAVLTDGLDSGPTGG